MVEEVVRIDGYDRSFLRGKVPQDQLEELEEKSS
jgi:hypothetical protein